MGLLLVDGLNTWLPKIMEVAGYSTGDALGLLPALNLGAIVGPFLGGALVTAGDRVPVGVLPVHPRRGAGRARADVRAGSRRGTGAAARPSAPSGP
jgi:hypothetical protein